MYVLLSMFHCSSCFDVFIVFLLCIYFSAIWLLWLLLNKHLLLWCVQNGSECFCGNSYDRLGTANNCNRPCSGNSTQICGGPWALSVYYTGRFILLAYRGSNAFELNNSINHGKITVLNISIYCV